VSIYAGNGKIVHAPQTGDVVKVVTLASYGRRLVGAVRP
jgi:cell wall-associated NlpC family hydrolase